MPVDYIVPGQFLRRSRLSQLLKGKNSRTPPRFLITDMIIFADVGRGNEIRGIFRKAVDGIDPVSGRRCQSLEKSHVTSIKR